jgi:hypothetical protein
MNLRIEKKEVIRLSDEQVEYLNSLDSIQKFPNNIKTPTLSFKVKYAHRKETGGRCIIANEPIRKGEIVCYGDSSTINKPIKYSYQIDDNIHLIGPGGLDHNCSKPTCGIERETNNFIALRDIESGELLTYNYLSTEYEMNTPFKCLCGEVKCFNQIKGFKYLNSDEKEYIYKNIGLSKYLMRKYIKSLNTKKRDS